MVGGAVRVPRHRAHRGQDAQADVVRRRGQATRRASSSGLPKGVKLPRLGSLLIGEKGSLLIPHVAMPATVARGDVRGLRRSRRCPAVDHYVGWADACRGEGKTTSHFDYAGPLTEAVLLGTIAIRVPGETLKWDAAAMKVTNSEKANALLRKAYRKGWEPKWISG